MNTFAALQSATCRVSSSPPRLVFDTLDIPPTPLSTSHPRLSLGYLGPISRDLPPNTEACYESGSPPLHNIRTKIHIVPLDACNIHTDVYNIHTDAYNIHTDAYNIRMYTYNIRMYDYNIYI